MKRVSILFILILFVVLGNSQTTFVSGVVTDKLGKPIGLAKIDVVGKNNSSVTDDEGKFGFTLLNTAKGDLVTFRVSKKGYKIAAIQIAVSRLPLQIKLVKSNDKNQNNSTKVEAPIETLNAPNAQIVTQNQVGGINTVINQNDSAEIKLKILKSTPPEFRIDLIIDAQKYLDLIIVLDNEVPIIYKAKIIRLDSIPIQHNYLTFGNLTVYRNGGKLHVSHLEYLKDSQFPQDSTYKVKLNFQYSSIYADEMQLPGLSGTVEKTYEINPKSLSVFLLP